MNLWAKVHWGGSHGRHVGGGHRWYVGSFHHGGSSAAGSMWLSGVSPSTEGVSGIDTALEDDGDGVPLLSS